MPRLARSDWYDLTRDMNWTLSYVEEAEAFPDTMCAKFGIPAENWWSWDEPYKISYREYVHNQTAKEASVYAVNSVVSRTTTYEQLDPGWKSAALIHFSAAPFTEYMAGFGELRMARFGRAAAWRNQAVYGFLDEIRHAQIHLYFSYQLLAKEPRMDWAHKEQHTNNWGAIANRSEIEDLAVAGDAVSIGVQLPFSLETGFTNLHFMSLAADALSVGDIDFASLVASVQTDEARHAQQGAATIAVLTASGRKDVAQRLVDISFWRGWRLFSLLTGVSTDYYSPLEHRERSFKEFMNEWIVKQFLDQIREAGLDKPWYWDDHFLPELDWIHHAYQLGLWYLRPTLWWDPDAGMSTAERDWLEQKYPGWNETFGKPWDMITRNVREGALEHTVSQTLPVMCNLCDLAVLTPLGHLAGRLESPAPLTVERNGRIYSFCSAPCKWIFEQDPERYAGHLSLSDRFAAGQIQPATLEGVLAYMGISPAESGKDATGYAWAEPDRTPAPEAITLRA